MDELLGQLRTAGKLESEGRFTLDLGRALEQMRRFQLADPRHYVLNLVAGAAALGAGSIDLRWSPDAFEVEWDGPPLSRENMLALLDPFAAEGTEGLRELARGLAASRALEPAALEAESGQAYFYLDKASFQIEPRSTARRNRVEVRVKRPVWQRFLAPDPSQPALLQERCRYSTLPIHLNGSPLLGELEPPQSHAMIYLEGPPDTRLRTHLAPSGRADFSALLALTPVGSGTIHALHHQVSYPLDDPELYPGAFVVLSARGLQKELSQSTLVRTPELTAILERIMRELDGMALQLTAEDAPGTQELGHHLTGRLRRRLAGFESSGRNTSFEPWSSLARSYWQVPFLRSLEGRKTTLAQTVPLYVRHGFLPVSNLETGREPTLEDGNRILLRPNSGPLAELVDLFFPQQCPIHFSSEGPHLTGDRFLCPRLPDGPYLVRRFLTGVAGELGFSANVEAAPRLLLKPRGEPAQELGRPLSLLPRGLVVVVRPAEGWDVESLERAVAASLPEAYAALDWGRREFPAQERGLAGAHLREAARLGLQLWQRQGRPTATARDYLRLRMHEGGPEIRFINPDLLEELPEDKVIRAYRGLCET